MSRGCDSDHERPPSAHQRSRGSPSNGGANAPPDVLGHLLNSEPLVDDDVSIHESVSQELLYHGIGRQQEASRPFVEHDDVIRENVQAPSPRDVTSQAAAYVMGYNASVCI